MRRAAGFSVRMMLLGTLAACFGNALYRWWRHGSVDWIGVLEFGIGWLIATAFIEAFSRRRRKRRALNSAEEAV